MAQLDFVLRALPALRSCDPRIGTTWSDSFLDALASLIMELSVAELLIHFQIFSFRFLQSLQLQSPQSPQSLQVLLTHLRVDFGAFGLFGVSTVSTSSTSSTVSTVSTISTVFTVLLTHLWFG